MSGYKKPLNTQTSVSLKSFWWRSGRSHSHWHPTPMLTFKAAANISVSGVTNGPRHPSRGRTTSMRGHGRRGERREWSNERQRDAPADGKKRKGLQTSGRAMSQRMTVPSPTGLPMEQASWGARRQDAGRTQGLAHTASAHTVGGREGRPLKTPRLASIGAEMSTVQGKQAQAEGLGVTCLPNGVLLWEK